MLVPRVSHKSSGLCLLQAMSLFVLAPLLNVLERCKDGRVKQTRYCCVHPPPKSARSGSTAPACCPWGACLVVLCASYASERLPLKTLHLTEFSSSTLDSTWLLAPLTFLFWSLNCCLLIMMDQEARAVVLIAHNSSLEVTPAGRLQEASSLNLDTLGFEPHCHSLWGCSFIGL